MNKILSEYTSLVDKTKPISDEEFEIPLISDTVVSCKPYPIKNHLRDKLKHVDDLLATDTIAYTNSTFASPSFPKLKPNGDIRLLIDYRQLNANSIKLEFYFPTIQETFIKIKGKRIFSKIDLERGFYQISIKKEDRFKTAFITPFGKFQFNRVPFGLTNASKYFNSLISKILNKFEI